MATETIESLRAKALFFGAEPRFRPIHGWAALSIRGPHWNATGRWFHTEHEALEAYLTHIKETAR